MTSGIPSHYGTDQGIISSLKRHDLIYDTDRDLILDRDDFDIDNDGIPNDCDLAPFDKTIGDADSDHDGIPDFCDLTPHGEENVTDAQKVQQEVWEKFGIMLNMNESFKKEFEPKELKGVLEMIATKATLPGPDLLTLTLTRAQPIGEFGVYDSDWKNIRLRPSLTPHDEFPGIKNSSWTMVHELFHFVAQSNKKTFKAFQSWYENSRKNETLTYPTEYSKLSQEEYFAEQETLKYFF